MEKTEEEIQRLGCWRKSRNLTVEQDKTIKKPKTQKEAMSNFRFYRVDPEFAAPDLENVDLRKGDNSDRAIFSIPQSYTEKTRTVYKQHDNTEFGFDLQLYLTRNNTPNYPLRKC